MDKLCVRQLHQLKEVVTEIRREISEVLTDREVIGNITINSPFGIFGKLNTNMTNGVMDKAMPIALSHQVKEGRQKY